MTVVYNCIDYSSFFYFAVEIDQSSFALSTSCVVSLFNYYCLPVLILYIVEYIELIIELFISKTQLPLTLKINATKFDLRINRVMSNVLRSTDYGPFICEINI